jgi:hypothetical protein
MTRHLFVLSRRDPELYSYLKERFAGDRAVEVVLDRRHAERRQVQAPSPIERRRQSRRTRPGADAELLTRSHTIITIPEVFPSDRPDRRLSRSSRVGTPCGAR